MKNNIDVVIIGSGLFGSMTAKHLRSKGLEVMIIDSGHPMAASKCSFGVYKEGWIDKVKDKVDYGMDVIMEHTDVTDITFIDLDKKEDVTYKLIDCHLILNEITQTGKVVSISDNLVIFEKFDGKQVAVSAMFIVVAAGVWTPELLISNGYKENIPTIDKYWGAILEVNPEFETGNKISQWAPYKQNVLVNIEPNRTVFGDGTSVKNPVESDVRVDKNAARIIEHFLGVAGKDALDQIVDQLEGYRPYLKEGDYVNQHSPRVFSATGGAKNSTVLSGYVAKRIYELIEQELTKD